MFNAAKPPTYSKPLLPIILLLTTQPKQQKDGRRESRHKTQLDTGYRNYLIGINLIGLFIYRVWSGPVSTVVGDTGIMDRHYHLGMPIAFFARLTFQPQHAMKPRPLFAIFRGFERHRLWACLSRHLSDRPLSAQPL